MRLFWQIYPFLLWTTLTFAQKWTIRERFDLLCFDGRFETALNELNLEYRTIGISFIHHRILFWKAMLLQDKYSLEEFNTQSPVLLKQIKNRKKQKYGLYFLAEVYWEKFIADAFQKNYVSAFKNLNQAYSYATKSLKADPKIQEPYRIIGLTEILLSTLPEEYKTFLNSFGVSADLEKGYTTFQKAKENSRWLKLENELVEFFIQRKLLKNQHSADSVISRLNSFDDPPVLFRFLKGVSFLDNKQNDSLYQLLSPYLSDLPRLQNDTRRFPYIAYLLGKTLFYKQKYSDALRFFRLFLTYYKGQMFVEDTKIKMAFSYLFSGNSLQAESLFKELSQQEKPLFEQDKAAVRLASEIIKNGLSQYENKLLKARFLIDGGYLEKALAILNQVQTHYLKLNSDEKTMLFYYLARAYHFQDKKHFAKNNYQKAMQQNSGRYKWMGAYSSYYIATILEEQEDWPNARTFYRRAMQFTNHPYKNTLEALSKAGLERLKNKKYDVPEE